MEYTSIELMSEKNSDRLKEITDRLEQGVTELFESERYKEYLRVMARFHNYSFNNTLLIAMENQLQEICQRHEAEEEISGPALAM